MKIKGGFCRFYKHLYWGESVKWHSLVKWKLLTGRGQFKIFCITEALGKSDQLEIVHCAFLRQLFYKAHPVMIYGIASGYDEAVDIILKISQEASNAGMDGRLIDYLGS